MPIDSISIRDAVDLAFKNSPLYYESKLSLNKAQIGFYQSLSNLLPTISVTGSLTKTKFDEMTSEKYTNILNLSMPVFDLDILSSIIVARGQLEGTRIQHKSELANLILRVKTAYYSLVNGRELLKSSEIAIERAQKNAELVATKYTLGSASKLEELQAEVFYLRALQDRSKARTIEITAHEELKTLIGLNRDFFPIDSIPEPDTLVFSDLDSLITNLDRINYNVRVANEMRRIARLNLWASCLSFLPRVSVFYGKALSSDSLVFDYDYFSENATTNYGINVSLPIFEIKSLIFKNLNARNDLHQKEYSQIRTLMETEKALKTSYYSLQESYDRLRFARKSFDAADEAAKIAAERYALGVLSLIDLLSTESSVYEARVTYTQTLTDFYIQKANFSYLIGALIE